MRHKWEWHGHELKCSQCGVDYEEVKVYECPGGVAAPVAAPQPAGPVWQPPQSQPPRQLTPEQEAVGRALQRANAAVRRGQ